jgi:proliferating cell nuclear antigen
MKLSIHNKNKKDLFIAIFQSLKNCSTFLNLLFKKDCLFIQGMDKAHVCMFEVCIMKSWFHLYENGTNTTITVDSHTFFTVLSVVNDHYYIELYQQEEDYLNIDLVTMDGVVGEFSKYFKIQLAEAENELLNIPKVDYDAEFSIGSKKICEITSQMLLFGTDMNIQCTEEKIQFITNGVTGEMAVNIPIDDLKEYSISEGEFIDLKYSLNYISKMCLTNKLSPVVEFSISQDYPMKIKYDLGDLSSMLFYIAPKIGE